ncbi:MAG TPA: pyridoxamine 5'-phosphate oxidase family protein [Acidimicrobiales bacterium]|nr:pyridoxamine 5'-phosphate oxidase family protein [Acidimicrobiales bacterium]
MAEMTEEAWRRFLRDPARPAAPATVGKDGRPHVAPVWIALDDGDTVVFTSGATTVKGRAVRAALWSPLCVDDDRPPSPTSWSRARPRSARTWRSCWSGPRGSAAGAWARTGPRRSAGATPSPGELLVRVTPARVVPDRHLSG